MFVWPGEAEHTHVELSDEAGHVVVLEEPWEGLFGETLLIQHKETVTLL
jgi:hypothetical protein